ncbi:hypothetical protein [Bradyrhizobium jicamae]|uniref:hypothetical protein n=1 Tax=Bradyrhizobium jicamae TaxID=280332 RepID=UPI001BAAEA5F|nr:hypothetical protein [Bradyrhizobium jicamae]MBR0934862.1 hypothetical protein [Bradyrhizobium jicamae]
MPKLTENALRYFAEPIDGRSKMGRALKAAERRRRAIATKLIGGLGRPPTEADEVWASNLASMVFRAEALESAGGDTIELRRLINQMLKPSAKPASAPQQEIRRSPAERWATKVEPSS